MFKLRIVTFHVDRADIATANVCTAIVYCKSLNLSTTTTDTNWFMERDQSRETRIGEL